MFASYALTLSRSLRLSFNRAHYIFSCPSSTRYYARFSTALPDVPDFYTEEHHKMSDMILKLMKKEIFPYIDEWEEKKSFPSHKVFKKFGDQGLLGVNKPVEYGGLGLDQSFAVAMAETLGQIPCGGVPMAIGVHTDMSTPALAKFGSSYLKKEYLTSAIRGDVVTCIGISEPGAGSDVSGVKTTAKLKGDDFVINGSKMWITNGVKADWMCLLALTEMEEKNPYKSMSLIILPLKSKGVHVEKKIEKLGTWSSDTALFHFDNVIVPAKNLIGERGKGFKYQMLQFQEERLWAVANSISSYERVIKMTAEYCSQRQAFGRPLLSNQVIQFSLAELQVEVEALRSLIYRATKAFIRGEDVTRLATMAKYKAGPLSRKISDTCLQYWGGMGYAHESLISRVYRDSRLMSIGGGADEVMLQILTKQNGWPDTYYSSKN